MASERLPVSRPFAALGQLIVRAPWVVLATILVVTVGLGAAASKIQVNNANDVFFVEDDPLLVAHNRFEQRFGSDEFVMVYVEGDLFTQEAFTAVNTLVKQMEEVTWEGEKAFTGIVTPFHAPTVRDVGGSIQIAPLLSNQDNPTAEDLARAKKDATEHPVYKDLIVNHDGTAGAVVATVRAMDDDNAYQMFLAGRMEALVDTPALRDLGVLLVGNPVFKKQMDQATVEEASLFGSAAILVSVLALFLMFRRKRQVVAAIGVVVIAVIWTVGLMSVLGFEMSLVSIILPLAIVIMGLGSGVHLINEFREHRFRGARRSEAVTQALGVMGTPALLTAVTTGIGFLAMLTAPVVPMRELGLFAAVGVLVAYLLAITLVPAVLSLGDDSPENPDAISRHAREHKIEGALNSVFGRIGDFVVARAAIVTLVFAVVSVGLGYGLTHTVVESHMIQAFRPEQQFRQAVEHVDKKLGGSTGVELVIDSGVPGGVYDADFLRRVEVLQAWILESQGDVVGSVLSLADLMKEVNFAFTGTRSLPESKARAAQLMLLYESGDGDTRMVIDHGARRARMSIRTRQTTTTRSLALEAALRGKAEALFADWKQPAASASIPNEASASEDGAVAENDSDEDEDLIVIEEEDPEAAKQPPGQAEASAVTSAGDDDDIIIIEDEDEPSAAEDALAARADSGSVTVEHGAAARHLAERNDEGDNANDSEGAPAAVATDDPPLAPGASRIELAGTSQLFVHLAEYVIDSQLSSFALAAFIISILMVLMLRSVTLGLAVMVPNILPIICTYGIMGWVGISVDWLTALIGVAALGVAVDGTIHIGTRYRLNRGAGMDAKEAAHAVLTSTGRAILVTSGVLVAGFLVVTPSILASLASFGMLMALCLFLALLFDIVMTTAVLAWLSPPGKSVTK